MSDGSSLPDLFAQALEAAPAERERLLAGLRATAPELASRLAELLAAAAVEGSLLDSPLTPPAALTASPARDEVERPPERIGPYRLRHELGKGGMGRVFLAEEEREAFRRTVALKVIARPGFAEETIRRFRDEVRILAALEHPGIARFLDGGRAPDGTWYLALEYVEGTDLLSHARERDLDARQRISLLLVILDAVAYAHACGVVHRDLKPGNILVGVDGRPRLLDFGISKLADPAAADDTTATRTELRAFTPAYASPEQFRGERATAASDVYSLGVVLYELLAGARPFGELAGTPAELERAVLERDPDPPSTAARRLATATAERAAGAPAERKGTGETTNERGARSGAPGPALRLDRDLDAICLKALRKDPGERYAGVALMADDLRRWLAGQAVEARRGGRRYRLGRFARRRRAELGSAAALALALAAMLFAARAQWRAGQSDRPPEPPVPRPFPYSAVNAPPLAELEQRFAAEPGSVETGAALALALTREDRRPEAALIVSRLRQIPGHEKDALVDYVDGMLAGRGDQPQRSLVLYTRALDNALATGRGELVGQIRAARGRTHAVLGRRAEGRADMEAARADFAAADDQASLARVLNDLAIEELENGKLTAGERLLEAALAATRKVSPTNRGGSFLGNLAVISFMRGQPDVAEPRMREVVAIFRDLGRPAALGGWVVSMAQTLWDLGRTGEAEPLLAEGLTLLREHKEDARLAGGLTTFGEIELERGRTTVAGEAAAEIEAAAIAAGDEISLSLAELLRGRTAAAASDLAGARRHLAEARRLALENGNVDVAGEADLALAEQERAAGNLEPARRAAEAAAAPFRVAGEHRLLFGAEAVLAWIDAREGRRDSARARLAELDQRLPGGGARAASLPLRLGYLRARAQLALAEGRPVEARQDLEAAVAAAAAGGRGASAAELRQELTRAGST